MAASQQASVTRDAFSLDDLCRILVDRVGLEEFEITRSPDVRFEDLGLDSLARVEVLLAIQQDYDLVLPDEDAEHLQTLGDAVAYVNERIENEVG
jgi:acyl carrier protein